jgi:hypothetical protein
MIRLLQREFDVPVSLTTAWLFLARVQEWPRWAAHIRQVDVVPAGELGPNSSGRIHLANGIRSTFRMREFHPGKNWKWVGPFLWLTVHYDHRFEAVGQNRTRLTWLVDAEGFGASIVGRVFANVYSRNLDKAIPALVSSIGQMTNGDRYGGEPR